MKFLIIFFLTVVLFHQYHCSQLSLLLPSSAYQDPTANYSESHSANVWGRNVNNTVTQTDQIKFVPFLGLQWNRGNSHYQGVNNYNSSDAVAISRLGQTASLPPRNDESAIAPNYQPYYGMPNNQPYYGASNGLTYYSPYGNPSNPQYSAPNGPYGMPNSPGYGSSYGMPNNAWYGAPNSSPYGMPNNPSYGTPSSSSYGVPYNPSYGSPNNAQNGMPYNPSYGFPNSAPNAIPYNHS